MEKRKNKEAIIIILLIVALVGVIAGFTWYNLNLDIQNNNQVVQNTQTNLDQTIALKDNEIATLKQQITSKDTEIVSLKQENEQLKKKEESVKVSVSIEEAVNYSFEKLKVRLPKISNGGKNAEILNKKMLNMVLASTYSRAKSDETLEYGADGFTVKYDYFTKNNIIAIYISIIENSGAEYPASGDGILRFNYFYDINADKELSFDEGVSKMDIKDYVISNHLMGNLLLIENGKLLKEYKAI